MSTGPITRRRIIAGLAALPAGLSLIDAEFAAAEVHQEVVFGAGCKRVYAALVETEQFDKVTRLSAAMKAGMPAGAPPTQISRETGGAFSLFGGYISGRHIELVPGERIVQAWRTAKWNPGDYSIVTFRFTAKGSATQLVFDHRGFPAGEAKSLAKGWHINYWEPLQKYLA